MTSYSYETTSTPPENLVLGGLNNIGGFVGSAGDYQTNAKGYLYSDGKYSTLTYPGAVATTLSDINDSGQVTGSYRLGGGDNPSHGFLYDGTTFKTIDVPGSRFTEANAISNDGTIVGDTIGAGGASGKFSAFIYTAGNYTTFSVPNSTATLATGVNEKGQVVGYYDQGSGANEATNGFVYANGTFQTIKYPGASLTFLNSINNDGVIVGSAIGLNGSNDYTSAVKFTYKDGAFNTIDGTRNAGGINDRGQLLVETQEGKVAVTTSANPLCFATGTLIRTTRGDVPVEALAVGDVAITATGTRRPVCWIGHRTLDCAAAPRPFGLWPVRVRAGAFGPGLPARDLRLSPGHPVLVGADADGRAGVLVPIMCLINGTTIAREPTVSVTYWHVELDAHDLLLAEGVPAESYHDMGSRPWFAGEDGPLIDPDFVPAGEHGRCRPVAVDGPQVEAERLRLSAVFAATLGAQCGWDEAERFAWLAA